MFSSWDQAKLNIIVNITWYLTWHRYSNFSKSRSRIDGRRQTYKTHCKIIFQRHVKKFFSTNRPWQWGGKPSWNPDLTHFSLHGNNLQGRNKILPQVYASFDRFITKGKGGKKCNINHYPREKVEKGRNYSLRLTIRPSLSFSFRINKEKKKTHLVENDNPNTRIDKDHRGAHDSWLKISIFKDPRYTIQSERARPSNPLW